MIEMPFDLPQTPQSPSNTPGSTDTSSKNTVSPRINTSLPTPAHSINGSMSTINSAIEASQSEDPTNKRKRDVEDLGDRDQKKVHVEDSRPSIDDLHQDVGKKYLLCRTLHKPQHLNIKQDLYDRFGLQGIAASLARVTPDGKKNTVRKTYKGYVKSLGIAGQFDAVKGPEPDQPGSLYSLINPGGPTAVREAWDQIEVQGREIDKGIPDELRSSLSKAVIMARGTIPKDRWNHSVIGEMGNQIVNDPLKAVPAKAKAPISQGTMSVPKQNRGAADIARPKRTVKKRSYGDASYEGYGEGYIDDEAGYSTGDGDDRAGGRKRPKKTPTSHGFQGPMRQSYGPGMVGA
ncbi:2a35c909-96a0-4f26-bf0d-42f083a574ca [Sclerotinia trifoliorum]|uniref:Mediator of RNA polymerase II transcription subunit 19 n=1 Tax=Sclerotinia trifoliorum TaxID=28548 RepID=A0A8H2ZL83_9HELO|nr:2a35c909-96a0-4f26-bf0d-42f083a574ca [Sclerotinia trifoliorum]